MRGFLDYVPGDSLLHRLNPLTKLILSLVLCAACFAADSIIFCLGMIGLDLLLARSAGIAGRTLSMLKVLVKFCAVLFIMQTLLIRDGNALISLPPLLVVTDMGLRFSLLMALRLIGATLPPAMMLSVTKMADLSNVLVGKLGLPYKYAFALTTAIRFIPVFTDEMAGIIEAQTARGIELDTKNLFKKIRLILPLCAPLLITSAKKIEGAAMSAELRGWSYRRRDCGYKLYPFTTLDFAAGAVGTALLAAAILA